MLRCFFDYAVAAFTCPSAAATDLISGGRLQLGVSRGSPETVLEGASVFGYQPPAGGTTALDAAGWHSGSEPLKSTWSGRAIAALVIPALILLVVWLL